MQDPHSLCATFFNIRLCKRSLSVVCVSVDAGRLEEALDVHDTIGLEGCGDIVFLPAFEEGKGFSPVHTCCFLVTRVENDYSRRLCSSQFDDKTGRATATLTAPLTMKNQVRRRVSTLWFMVWYGHRR